MNFAPLGALKREREFPIHLGALPSQVRFETDLPQEITPKHKVSTLKDIDLPAFPPPRW